MRGRLLMYFPARFRRTHSVHRYGQVVGVLIFFALLKFVVKRKGERSNLILAPDHTKPPVFSGSCRFKTAKFAAVMFHSDAGEFEAVLQDLVPHIDDKWVIRLFLPWREDEIHSKLFNRTRQKIQSMVVMNRLALICVRAEIFRHDMSELGFHNDFGDQGTHSDGPLIANHFLLSKETYKAIPEEHILFFQQDAAFCSGSNRTLESFMHHKYLGAAWPSEIMIQAQNGSLLKILYGNGGLSIRSKRFVLFCISLVQYQEDWEVARIGKGIPEDVFFSRCLFEHFKGNIDVDEARAFAAEGLLDPDNYPFLAVHDPCRFAGGATGIGCATEKNRKLIRDVFRICPESRRVIARCVSDCVVSEY